MEVCTISIDSFDLKNTDSFCSVFVFSYAEFEMGDIPTYEEVELLKPDPDLNRPLILAGDLVVVISI